MGVLNKDGRVDYESLAKMADGLLSAQQAHIARLEVMIAKQQGFIDQLLSNQAPAPRKGLAGIKKLTEE